ILDALGTSIVGRRAGGGIAGAAGETVGGALGRFERGAGRRVVGGVVAEAGEEAVERGLARRILTRVAGDVPGGVPGLGGALRGQFPTFARAGAGLAGFAGGAGLGFLGAAGLGALGIGMAISTANADRAGFTGALDSSR